MKSPRPAALQRLSVLCLCALALGPVVSHAEINLRRETARITDPWSDLFAEGAIAASVRAASESQAVAIDFGSNNYVAQSLIGNDQYLKGVAFYGGGLNGAPTEYIVSVLDYGVRPPIMELAQFNPTEPPAMMTSGTILLGRENMAQVYISFTGADSVFLKKDHAYVIMIASTRDSSARFFRAVGDDGYTSGTGAMGPMELNPHLFSSNGTRDLLFALYTTPVGR